MSDNNEVIAKEVARLKARRPIEEEKVNKARRELAFAERDFRIYLEVIAEFERILTLG